jgi:hypothetical protein
MKFNIDILNNKKIHALLITIFFILGLYYYVNSYKFYENMENKPKSSNIRCPNMLIEKKKSIIDSSKYSSITSESHLPL